jgi:hypothetical protein
MFKKTNKTFKKTTIVISYFYLKLKIKADRNFNNTRDCNPFPGKNVYILKPIGFLYIC